jgi:hypothetical protein
VVNPRRVFYGSAKETWRDHDADRKKRQQVTAKHHHAG